MNNLQQFFNYLNQINDLLSFQLKDQEAFYFILLNPAIYNTNNKNKIVYNAIKKKKNS